MSFSTLPPPSLLLLLCMLAAASGGGGGEGGGATLVETPPPPLLSIIFITKRPGPSLPLPLPLHIDIVITHYVTPHTSHAGGYDILLSSLALQSSRDYELICIDELAPWRRAEVEAAAAALHVNLVHMTRSKPRARESRFGIANAINSGLLLARGRYITVLQDYIFLPARFVETSIGMSHVICTRAMCHMSRRILRAARRFLAVLRRAPLRRRRR